MLAGACGSGVSRIGTAGLLCVLGGNVNCITSNPFPLSTEHPANWVGGEGKEEEGERRE
jgi:hypothetical protein